MRRCTRPPYHVIQLAGTLLTLVVDTLRYLSLCVRSPAALAAENLLLRKQPALYRERGIQPRRATHASRIALTVLARWLDWRQALVIVQPATLIRWHRRGSICPRIRTVAEAHARGPTLADIYAQPCPGDRRL